MWRLDRNDGPYFRATRIQRRHQFSAFFVVLRTEYLPASFDIRSWWRHLTIQFLNAAIILALLRSCAFSQRWVHYLNAFCLIVALPQVALVAYVMSIMIQPANRSFISHALMRIRAQLRIVDPHLQITKNLVWRPRFRPGDCAREIL